MKKVYLLLIGMGLFFQSCEMKEELNVSSNEEFEFNYSINFSELLQSAQGGKNSFTGGDGFLNEINGKELTMEEFLDVSLRNEKDPKAMKDSIMKADADSYERAKNVRFKATLNDTVGDITLKFKGKGIEELNNSLHSLNRINETTSSLESSKKEEGVNNTPMFFENAVFSYKRNIFERKVKVDKKEKETKKEEEGGGMEGFFTYKIVVNFDRPIKKVSYDDAEISEDGKSFIKTFSMIELIEHPELLEYKVELKK